MIFVIGVGHKARQGKSTFSTYLEHCIVNGGGLAKRISFSDSLKSFYRIEEGNYDTKDPVRLQTLAEDIKQKHGEDVFAKDLVARIKDNYKTLTAAYPGQELHAVYIVDDLRHKVEVEALKEFDQHLFIRLIRENYVADDRDPNHRSETELDNLDWVDCDITANNLYELKAGAIQLFSEVFLGSETDSSGEQDVSELQASE